MIDIMKRSDGKAFSIEISFTRPFYFHWCKEIPLTFKDMFQNVKRDIKLIAKRIACSHKYYPLHETKDFITWKCLECGKTKKEIL